MDANLRRPTLLLSYANLAIGALLILGALFFTRDIMSLFMVKEKKAKEPWTQGQRGDTQRGLQDYASILKNNPFGISGEELKRISPSFPSAGPTSPPVELSLIGTVSGPKGWGYAIFSDKSGNQEVFMEGDSVFGMGRLDQVRKDRVLIKQGGRQVEIPLMEMGSIKDSIRPQPLEIGHSHAVQQTGSESYVFNKKMVLKAIENPSQIMTEARLLPNILEGRQQGFVLTEMKPGGIYQSIGLQDGDVLLRINDFDISSPESALQAFTALKGMDVVQLDIIRDGTPMTLTYRIQ